MNVLLLETIAADAMYLLEKSQYTVIENYDKEINPSINLMEVDAIITRGLGIVQKELIDKCPKLKVIARCGIGLNNIDVDYASSKNIKVINAPGSNANTVAEHTLSLMLIAVRNMYNAIEANKNNNWPYRNVYQGDELNGKKIGIVGLGNIGSKVARLATAFGMEVYYWSRSAKDVNYQYLHLEELVSTVDVLSVHIELNNETANIFDLTLLQKCKKEIVIINTARAEIFDTKALIECLSSGHLKSCAVDVPFPSFEKESFHSLMAHPNSYITPHVSSLTTRTFNFMCTEVVTNVVKELSGEGASINNIANSILLK